MADMNHRDYSQIAAYGLACYAFGVLIGNTGPGCASLRGGRAATVAALEAPVSVSGGSTVTEALGAAITANIEKTDKLADAIERIEARDVNVGDRIGGNGDSIGLWVAIVSLASTSVLGDVLNWIDRRRFHRRNLESRSTFTRLDDA